MEFLKNLSVYLTLFIIVGIPSFFWVRWAIRSFKKKRKLEFTVSSFSFLLFISGWAVMELSPKKYFKHDSSVPATAIYNYFTIAFLFSITIVLVYFLAKGTIWFIKYMFSKAV